LGGQDALVDNNNNNNNNNKWQEWKMQKQTW